jgi:translocation and assembly module TamB
MELQKTIVVDGRLNVRGPLGRRWLPPGYSFDTAVFSGAFSGQLQQLNHSGELQISNGVTPYIQPLQLRAAWRGQSAIFSSVQAQVESTNLSLSAEGGGQIGSGKLQLELAALSLSTNQHPALTLTAPCRITAERHSNPPVGWALAISSLQLKGPGGEIHAQAGLNWPRQGQVELTMRNLPSTLFSEFSGQQALPFQLRELESFAVWTNAPMGFRLKLSADGLPPNIFRRGHRAGSTAPSGSLDAGAGAPATAGPSIPIRIQLEANGDRHGVAISNLVVTSQGSTVVNAHGFLPVTLNPASPTNLFHMERAQTVSFSAAVHPESFFWKELAAQTGLSLGEPQLTAGLSGTWPALQGRIELAARQIHLQTTRTNLPSLEQLHVSLLLDRDRVQLTRGQLLVQGQPVDLTGELPLAQGFWARVRDKPLPDWQKLRLQLRIPKAQFAAFQPLFPTLLAPQGDLSLELSVVPGLKLEGGLLVENARTRPLGSAGPLRDIRVQLRFQNRAVKLERASANLGGSALTVTGQADLSGTNWLHGALPPFVLSLQGLSVPLARDPEFILRSDLLLGIVKTNGAPPLISGTARLRDSFYLSDLQALVPGKVATPAGRPPYFSVEELWLADWRLALDVQGERFLKVRSPLFADEVSAKLKVIGTLKDPIALGDLKIDSGVVRFPFGALQVQQGLIVLASQDPYHPQITLNAASKQYGYEIRMEVTGPVDNPVIQFTSTPPLNSEQILLMVTAGQMPQGTFSLTPQQRAQTMALFLGRDLLTKLGFGDQAQQRLTIRSGEEISEQGRPTYHVEYKLTDRWSLEGEYDRFGDFNAGFKWRVYSK